VIGLVLVSHSARLAEGAAELAAQMAGPDVRIVATGGLDQPDSPLGTDATLVAAAIERAWSPDGVLVLMDLGSAVLSAELALELLPPERRERVRLTAAPLVEGAVAAAVAAALGGTLDTVAGEARDGLAAKAAHLAAEARGGAQGEAPDASPTGATAPDAAGEAALRLRIDNPLGLHARPAALFVRTAASFEATVTVEDVTVARGPVSARSLNAVATLGVARGHEIVVRAHGPRAHDALAALARLAAAGFGEPPGERGPAATGPAATGPAATGPARPAVAMRLPAEQAAAAPAPGAVLHGLPASPGIAIGPARRLEAAVAIEAPQGPGADPEAEWTALQRALADTAADLTVARDAVAGRAGGYEAAIFDAHLLFLGDEALLGPARAAIFESGDNAAAAWAASAARAAAAWQALDDPYLRARAADLREVADQVMRHLLGLPAAGPAAAGGIVVTSDLTPAAAAALDGARVRGVACAGGGPTSHGAILARALGLPAVVGCGAALLAVAEGTALLLDGEAGTVTVAPPPALLEAAEASRAHTAAAEAAARADAARPALTRDGRAVPVTANLAGPDEVEAAVAAGADGVGLLRTEFLFLASGRPPGEEEQERVYRAMAERLAGRPLVVRTLDAGADKPLAFLPTAHEDNPFLGVRGIRLGLRHPELLAGQLRAVLRVAADHPVRLLLPMVTTVDEVRRVRALLDEARRSLATAAPQGATERPGPSAEQAGANASPVSLALGVMIEVPAAALMAEAFAPHVDFFSLGTNDLTQYVLAAERGNPGVAGLGDALHPAVLRLIDRVARAAAAAGRPLAVCGEVAGDPAAIPVLLGLGVTELSMVPGRIARAKLTVRGVELAAARRLAARALVAESAAEVRLLAGEQVSSDT
jgi:phosphocarrier protein FPr